MKLSHCAVVAGMCGLGWIVVVTGCKSNERRETITSESVREYEIVGPQGEVGASPGEPIVEPDAVIIEEEASTAPPPGEVIIEETPVPPGPPARERAAIRYGDRDRQGEIRVYEHAYRGPKRHEVIVDGQQYQYDTDVDGDYDDDDHYSVDDDNDCDVDDDHDDDN